MFDEREGQKGQPNIEGNGKLFICIGTAKEGAYLMATLLAVSGTWL